MSDDPSGNLESASNVVGLDSRRPTDVDLELLANPHRRRALEYLLERPDSSVPTEELLEFVIADCEREGAPVPSYEELFIAFHHTHLPRLAANDIVTHDRERSLVRYHPDERLEALCASVSESFEE